MTDDTLRSPLLDTGANNSTDTRERTYEAATSSDQTSSQEASTAQHEEASPEEASSQQEANGSKTATVLVVIAHDTGWQ